MKSVKWIFAILLISSLTAFIDKDKPVIGLNEGDLAPEFKINSDLTQQPLFDLAKFKGEYVLLSFWASYDAPSRMQNMHLNRALHTAKDVKMISISFDEYSSIFKETIRKDRIQSADCFVETNGENSPLFKRYRLNKGFTNYLLDKKGVIIAKDITADELAGYLNQCKG